MDGNSEQLQVINLKQLPIIEERLRDVKAKIEQRTSAVMALAVTEETRTDVKKIRTEVRKELEGYEAQRMAVKKAIMTPYEQFEAVYKECVSNPYKAADEALGKKIADVEAGIKQQKEDDVRTFFTELTSGFGLDWLKFEQLNLKVTLTCTPKAMKAAITQSVTKIVRDCAALEENPDRDEIMVEYQKLLDLGSACQIVQQRHKQLEAHCCKEACLMENNRKDPRRQLIGAVSKALGQQFERDINAAFDHYRRLGVASIEKTPEPFHMTGRENGGKVVGFYEKKAQPDYTGTLRGGRSVYMEAKFTGSNRMEQSRVSPGQTEYLDEKMRLGAFCYVLAGFSHGGAYCIPWSVWRSMKEHYGRKYITENDITQYKIPRTTTGMLAILGTGKE